MGIDVHITTLDVQNTDRHFCVVETQGKRFQLFHLPARPFVHPCRGNDLDILNDHALVLGDQQLHQARLIVQHLFISYEPSLMPALETDVISMSNQGSRHGVEVSKTVPEHTHRAGLVLYANPEHRASHVEQACLAPAINISRILS